MARSDMLDVEAVYVSAEGETVNTSVALLDGERVVRGLPVRKIRSYAKQKHYTGLFWSATTGEHIPYESRLELDRLWLADFDTDIEWMASQPVWFRGKDGYVMRRHVPDLLLKRRDGSFVVVDVKPAEFARHPEVAAVFDWTGRVCAARSWRFEVWSGESATVLANVRWLGLARRKVLVEPDALDAVRRAGLSGMTIGEVCASCSATPSRSRAQQSCTCCGQERGPPT